MTCEISARRCRRLGATKKRRRAWRGIPITKVYFVAAAPTDLSCSGTSGKKDRVLFLEKKSFETFLFFRADKEVGAIEQAHDSIVWTLAWHPLGHILCSGSNDHTSKFWTRNRPGDLMRDKYNLNTLPAGVTGLDDIDMGKFFFFFLLNEYLLKKIFVEEPSVIPGMGPDDKVDLPATSEGDTAIPGLDLDLFSTSVDDKNKAKKVPYSKPIPRNFQAQWNETGGKFENKTQLQTILTIFRCRG